MKDIKSKQVNKNKKSNKPSLLLIHIKTITITKTSNNNIKDLKIIIYESKLIIILLKWK